MKKTIKQILMATFLVACMVSFSGCGDNADPKIQSSEDTKADTTQQSSDTESSEKDVSEPEKKPVEEPENLNLKVFDPNNADDQKKVANAVLSLNGKEVSFPMTVKQLKDIGFKMADETMAGKTLDNRIVQPFDKNNGVDIMTYDDEGTSIVISTENFTNTPLKLDDCVVIGLSGDHSGFAINNLSAHVSTYEEIMETLGKPDKDCSSSFKKELEARGAWIKLTYLTNEIKNYYGDTTARHVSISYKMGADETVPDGFGKINSISYKLMY